MKILIIALLIGACAGAVAALAGVGGGILMVPAFKYFFDLDQKQAIATSAAVIVITALAISFQFAQDRLIHWQIFAFTAVGSAIVGFFVADRLKAFSTTALTRGFAILLILVGVKMLFEKPKDSDSGKQAETAIASSENGPSGTLPDKSLP